MMSESVTQMAWRRFSRGLPCEVDSVERALELRLRSFEQWRTCLDTANRQAERINRHTHRRAAGLNLDNVGWRSLRMLATGEPFTAEVIARSLHVHVDVVRRGLKSFRERGWLSSSKSYTREQPRVFEITKLGRLALERSSPESAEA